MKRAAILASLVLLCTSLSFSQESIPIILASDSLVDIREGDDFYQGEWIIMPEYRPDVFSSNKVGETVTFYTDLDSISYVIHPDSVYDFVILWNNQDSAFTQIRYEPSYLDILKNAADYDENEQVELPQFTYQDQNDQHLQALRTGFNLDSIAGTGNEISRILNLLHWVHNLIPHDGMHDNPTVKNAMSLIKECKAGNRGLNCRGLSTVLNECYLALGIKSRHITCMPKDSVFEDCHVINIVYSNDLEKWIWVDPTNDAYVMDETGTLLDPFEVRERLINDQPLILNPDANWNRKESTVIEFYLYEYMAKNLYRMECPVHSEYNYETPGSKKLYEYIELLPLDGLNQHPKVEITKNKKSKATTKTYKTNNPNLFWVKPNE